MDRLKDIICIADAEILNALNFAGAKNFGLCEQIFKEGYGTMPLYVDAAGRLGELTVTDNYPLFWYSRALQVNSERNNSFGYDYEISEAIAMRLVAGCRRDVKAIENITPYLLYELFASAMFLELSPAARKQLSLMSAVISPQNANLIGHNVFSNEFSYGDPKLPTTHVLISIDYLIQIKYLKKCKQVNICTDC